MTRITIIVEGQTEESFVNSVLAPALWKSSVYPTAIRVGRPGHRGGRVQYQRLKDDILRYLKQDPGAYCSTMVDFYGLGEGFPGTPAPAGLPPISAAFRIEQAVKAEICDCLSQKRPDVRFFPYIQIHEFEALLFSDPRGFAAAIHQPGLADTFQRIRDAFPTPEDIDNSPESAPSKRVLKAFPSYRKVLDGTAAAERVGVEAMQRECAHFRDWVEELAALGR